MRERTELGLQFDLLAEGEYLFTVAKPVEKKRAVSSDAIYYLWRLSYEDAEGKRKSHVYNCMPWLVGPILEALGYTLIMEGTKKVYDWDREEVNGRQFWATCKHEPDAKDKTKTRANLVNFKPAGDAPPEPPTDVPTEEDPIGF